MYEPLAIVMAAGKGTRMSSDLPKVLVEVAGRPMIDYVLESLRAAGVHKIVMVVGYRGELVRQALADQADVKFVEQSQQLGTGHAVMMCRTQLAAHHGAVVIVAGDSPLMQPDSLRTLLDQFQREQAACLLGTAHAADPTGLGRIVRARDGAFVGIVEHRDATDEERAITEVNMSTYVFDSQDLLGALDQLTRGNRQGEYYITDCPGILRRQGKRVEAACVLKPCEVLSINTDQELAAVEAEMARLGYAGK